MRPFPVWFLVVSLLAFSQSATAQELAQDRAPRFLLALDSRLTPVDIERTPLLGRRLSLSLDGATTIKEALGEIGRQSGLRLAYGDDVLPRDGRVHLRAEGITVVAALTDVLFDTDVDVVFSPNGRATLVRRPDRAQGGTVTGRVTDAKSGQAIPNASVVLEGTRWRATTDETGAYKLTDVAPGSYMLTASRIGYVRLSQSVTVAAGEEARVDVRLHVSANPLDAVVVTGTLVPTEVKALPTPISVITGGEIEQRGYQRVDQIFRGDVPGAIAWDEGPRNYFSNVSVRGASSLLVTPDLKTLVDGVEVADPTYIATIDPNSIDRIEITRGPQASTMYGAGALSGVTQIFTKKGRLGLRRPEISGKISVGGVAGYGGGSTSLQSDNTASVVGGDERTGYNLGGSYRRTGEWVSSYSSTDWGIAAGGQTSQGPLTVSGSARYSDKRFENAWDPRFTSYAPFSRPDNLENHLRQQTYGATVGFRAVRNWQHTVTFGFDRSSFASDQTEPRFITPSDSFVTASSTNNAKLSVLYHTDLNVQVSGGVSALITGGVNYESTDFASAFTYGATRITGVLDGFTSLSHVISHTTGYFGQFQLDFSERFFLTGGLRAERSPDFGADIGTVWSPRFGAAYVLAVGPASAKLRGSYGEGIRPPFPSERSAIHTPTVDFLANPALAPERQRGFDGGVEIYLGQASLGVTYYNQRAIDLIDLVTIPTAPGTLLTQQYQNVSRVHNDGWEFEAHLPIGPLQMRGTFTITNSTIRELPPGYTGTYQVGDRVIDVPHTTAGATITYSPLPRTTLSGSVTHIGPWNDFDIVAFYGFLFGGAAFRGSLRAYLMEYPPVTKFAVGVSQILTRNLSAFVRAENVGNNLRYEQSNFSFPTPRSVLIGATFRY